MALPPPIRVVGVGSPHGDDSLGWSVLRQLRNQIGEDSGIEWLTVDGGHRLLEILDGQGSLVLVDALVTGEEPGSIHQLNWPDPRVEVLVPGSTHSLKPAEALRLAETLGLLPEHVLIFGIEPNTMTPGAHDSAAVQAALPRLVDCIQQELLRRDSTHA